MVVALSAASAAAAAVSIQSVSKSFGSVQALKGVDLEIRRGEFFGLLGPNGAGKTTLISSLAGLTRPDSGSISVMGHDVQQDYRAARFQLGVVPQELIFDPFFSVRELLVIQSGYFGIRNNGDWIDEILANLDLTDKANANMRMLSGGMKRRVLVAQALVHRPPVIVLDEPTAGVDVELRQTLWAFIRRLNQDGHTIILTTHYLEEAESLCQRIAMLRAGSIVALDSTENLLRRFSSHSLRVKMTGAPPSDIEAHSLDDSGWYALPLDNFSALESVLAQLRLAGCGIEEVDITKPDLEEVFIKVMRGNQGESGRG